MSPVLKITPELIGKLGFEFWKNPMPLDELKLVPVFQVIFWADTQGELINTVFTNCGTVYMLELTVMACEKHDAEIASAIMSSNFFIVD
jgi:hypothetical protein